MDFKEFSRLYRKDTISFLIALNLYLGYGATVLSAGSKEDLSGAAALEISGLFAAESGITSSKQRGSWPRWIPTI